MQNVKRCRVPTPVFGQIRIVFDFDDFITNVSEIIVYFTYFIWIQHLIKIFLVLITGL